MNTHTNTIHHQDQYNYRPHNATIALNYTITTNRMHKYKSIEKVLKIKHSGRMPQKLVLAKTKKMILAQRKMSSPIILKNAKGVSAQMRT